jgi:amino acid permease
MNVARFRTAWLMIFIALAAFNFAAVRNALDNPDLVGQLLAFGFMPMASILTIGLLVGFLRRFSRPYLLGFESFGAIASIVYLLLVIFYRNEMVRPYACRFVDPLEKIMPTDESLSFVLIACPVLVLVLTLPQVTFALVGGFLTRRFIR